MVLFPSYTQKVVLTSGKKMTKLPKSRIRIEDQDWGSKIKNEILFELNPTVVEPEAAIQLQMVLLTAIAWSPTNVECHNVRSLQIECQPISHSISPITRLIKRYSLLKKWNFSQNFSRKIHIIYIKKTLRN